MVNAAVGLGQNVKGWCLNERKKGLGEAAPYIEGTEAGGMNDQWWPNSCQSVFQRLGEKARPSLPCLHNRPQGRKWNGCYERIWMAR